MEEGHTPRPGTAERVIAYYVWYIGKKKIRGVFVDLVYKVLFARFGCKYPQIKAESLHFRTQFHYIALDR